MIKFAFYRDGSGEITRLRIKGHSGYGEKGYDIVCSAVSTALWMAMKGIEAQGLAELSYEEKDGFVDCRITGAASCEARAILKSLEITVFELAKQYKRNVFIVNGKDFN